MRSNVSILTRGFGLSLLVGLVGCSSPALQPEKITFHPEAMLSSLDFSTAKISDLQKQKTNFTVHLQGKTGALAPLAGLSAYELQDSTGKIWIVTKSASPAPGSKSHWKSSLSAYCVGWQRSRVDLYRTRGNRRTRSSK